MLDEVIQFPMTGLSFEVIPFISNWLYYYLSKNKDVIKKFYIGCNVLRGPSDFDDAFDLYKTKNTLEAITVARFLVKTSFISGKCINTSRPIAPNEPDDDRIKHVYIAGWYKK